MDAATHGFPEEPTTADVISDLLAEQSRQIHSLSGELAKSYEKELIFFKNLSSRDKHLKAQESRFLKKIWWLESEHRRLTARAEQLTVERDQALRTVQKFKDSKLGKLQRRIWRARKVMRSWR